MKIRLVSVPSSFAGFIAFAALLGAGAGACGPSAPPATPQPTTAAAPAPEPAPAPAPPPPATAASTAPAPSAPPAADTKPTADVVTTGVTSVSNEITTPSVVAPDKVIAGLRPKFNACYMDGLKKAPKASGSVTLSAKIEKDGKVSAVTPKLVTDLPPAIVKCLADQLKAANFAPSGGINYTTSLDIPLSFTSNQ